MGFILSDLISRKRKPYNTCNKSQHLKTYHSTKRDSQELFTEVHSKFYQTKLTGESFIDFKLHKPRLVIHGAIAPCTPWHKGFSL